MGAVEETRVDKWLWAVRLYKTRGLATAACRGGHVRVNGVPAKPATPVRVGDRVQAHVNGRTRVLEVARVIDKRVGAPVAATCLVDHTPAAPPPERAAPAFVRERGAGRPTKRERRQLDRLRGRRA
ncbi:MAG TPA: RNA-binding S4 domain-containing protein [Acidimicrobiales bacterium]|jgi:ribosome-associated heat shock protein Hsp15|nr:RNA-binding S4 domain-containing protein [Acidimicrobiales bacterium]